MLPHLVFFSRWESWDGINAGRGKGGSKLLSMDVLVGSNIFRDRKPASTGCRFTLFGSHRRK